MAGLYTLQCTGNGVWAYVGLSSVEEKHYSIINPKKLKPVPIHAQTKPNPPVLSTMSICMHLVHAFGSKIFLPPPLSSTNLYYLYTPSKFANPAFSKRVGWNQSDWESSFPSVKAEKVMAMNECY